MTAAASSLQGAAAQAFADIAATGPGRIRMAGRALELLRALDACFLHLARASCAGEYSFPALLAPQVLDRAGYFESFPQGAMRVEGCCLSPAVCYHAYAMLAGGCLHQPLALTCVGKCFRNEAARETGRLREFTMREIVFLGPAGWVEEQRTAWARRIHTLARRLTLDASLELATDPFFGDAGRGRRILQRVKQLKYELKVPLKDSGPPIALASFNLHEQFFGTRFDINLPDGQPASTACVAFGLERWLLALEARHGLEGSLNLLRSFDHDL